MNPRILLIALSFLTLLSCKTEKGPNVVLILVDDLGWADIGAYGSDFYQTPNVDQLATEGVRFTDGYAACTVCSPTRAAIMTGKYPATINCTDWIEGWKLKGKPFKDPKWTMYMDTAEYTLAEAFADAGYKTAHIGKWHLGEDSLYWPENQGFDLNIGGWKKGSPNRNKKLGSKGYFPPFGNPRLTDKSEDEYLTERLSEEAITFIEESSTSDQPFYLNFWLYNVHTPLQAKKEKVDKYKNQVDSTKNQQNPTYAAMVEHMDEAVGKIIDKLKELGIYENTVLVFTSDNGGLTGRRRVTNNFPLRSGKGDMYEGGTRVPLIIKEPGQPSNGRESEVPAISMDLYPTLLSLAGIQKNIDGLEGVDLSPILSNKSIEDRDLFWHYPHYHIEGAAPYSAIRSGDWKLIYYYESDSASLHNLKNDIGETKDVSVAFPEMKSNLWARLNEWKNGVGAQDPITNPDFKSAAR